MWPGTVKGFLFLESVEGNVTASTAAGDVSIHLTDHSKVDIDSPQGETKVTVPEDVLSSIELRTEDLEVDNSLIMDITERDASSNKLRGKHVLDSISRHHRVFGSPIVCYFFIEEN